MFRNIFVTADAPDKIWLNLAYTFNDFRFDNDPTFGNNQLPGAPRHYLRAECSTSIRADSMPARIWSGCRNPTLSIAPTR